MAGTKAKPVTVEEFIAAFPADVRAGLAKIRQAIRKAAPQAEEVISYGIPAYRLNGMLIFFSAYKSHYSLAFPPVSAAFEVFKKPLSRYSVSKSTIQFPFGEPLPLPLIRDIAALRVKENMAKATLKTAAKQTAKKTTRKQGQKRPVRKANPKTIDEYIAGFPEDAQAVLEKMRGTIAKAAPGAEEAISYGMPAFRQGKVLIFFSAWKTHYSLFVPSVATLKAFGKELSKYDVHKATVKIPLSGPIPYPLIAAMTRLRVREERKSKP